MCPITGPSGLQAALGERRRVHWSFLSSLLCFSRLHGHIRESKPNRCRQISRYGAQLNLRGDPPRSWFQAPFGIEPGQTGSKHRRLHNFRLADEPPIKTVSRYFLEAANFLWYVDELHTGREDFYIPTL